MIVGMAPTCIKDEEDKENSLYHQVFLMDEDLKVILLTKYISFKGTVSVILSDPPCKDGNARFTFRYKYFDFDIFLPCTVGKNMGTIRNKHFETKKN